ncbi:hypothetical protein ACP4OV_031038 [Aristida adscensionis]
MGKPAAAADGDEAVFLELSRELRDEAAGLFNRGDFEGAAFKYGKAVQLLPRAQRAEAARLRASAAHCYMRARPAEHHRAIHECNLALEAVPGYSRALLRRAGCFLALDRPDLAWPDVERVLRVEPANRAAREISGRVRAALERKGVAVTVDEEPVAPEEVAAGVRGQGKSKKSTKHFSSAAEGQTMNRIEDDKLGNHVSPSQQQEPEGDSQGMHLGEKGLKQLRDKRENQSEERRTNGIGNRRSYKVCDSEINGLEKQQNDTMKDDGEKRGRHTAKKKMKRGEDKEKKHSAIEENDTDVKGETMKDVKLVFGEDIRCAQMPGNCTLSQLREIVQNKFPSMKALLIKYKDREGDLVTITSSEELRWANSLADPEGPMRLHVIEVDPMQELGVDGVRRRPSFATLEKNRYITMGSGNIHHADEHIYRADDWMIQFAQLFKNHVGFNSDAYLDLHDLGMRLYYEGMEDTIENEEAQQIFQIAEIKFQEMAALALFNWGNVHMCRARKRPHLPEDALLEFTLEEVKVSYEWACAEYAKAGAMFEEAVKTKSDFFEAHIALGKQQFEQAKLSWYYALACNIDMGTQVLELFNQAEDNMEKGMEIWEQMEILRLRGLSKPNMEKVMLEKIGLEGFVRDISADEAFEQASSIGPHINNLWGTILYERSVVEFNLGLPSWEESLAVAMDKFKIGGASLADINVIIKNHCANETTQEGLSFKVEEIVQAWNEMYDAKNWRNGVLSFRLLPILRRRAPKLHHILEHIHYT